MLVSLLIFVIILGIAIYIVQNVLPMSPQAKTIAMWIIGAIALIYLLSLLGVLPYDTLLLDRD
jgi:hypothetical protein